MGLGLHIKLLSISADTKIFQHSSLLNLSEKNTYSSLFNLIIKLWTLIIRRIYYGYSHKRLSLNISFVRTTIYYAYKLQRWSAKGGAMTKKISRAAGGKIL